MNTQNTNQDNQEVHELLTYLNKRGEGLTSILISKLFIHPIEKKEYWEDTNGFFTIFEKIFQNDLTFKFDNNSPVHISTSYTINDTFEIPIFTVTLVFPNQGKGHQFIHEITKHLIDSAEDVTGYPPELHLYPFEVFYSLIDELYKPNREEVVLEDGKGVIDDMSLLWLNNLCFHSFKTTFQELMNLRNSKLGLQIMDIENRTKKG
jgi:hypothetical protein